MHIQIEFIYALFRCITYFKYSWLLQAEVILKLSSPRLSARLQSLSLVHRWQQRSVGLQNNLPEWLISETDFVLLSDNPCTYPQLFFCLSLLQHSVHQCVIVHTDVNVAVMTSRKEVADRYMDSLTTERSQVPRLFWSSTLFCWHMFYQKWAPV